VPRPKVAQVVGVAAAQYLLESLLPRDLPHPLKEMRLAQIAPIRRVGRQGFVGALVAGDFDESNGKSGRQVPRLLNQMLGLEGPDADAGQDLSGPQRVDRRPQQESAIDAPAEGNRHAFEVAQDVL
jgi:hypothetical protein